MPALKSLMENSDKLKESRRYRLLGDGGIFDRIKNKEVGFIWERGEQEIAFELRGKEQQAYLKNFVNE